ncbi:peptide deformylase [Nonomuraea sp. NPDC059194]|uniref:peptide deformylase n=1 Tax=Nonomuraea sp. NPDC059194 TaxID=3346764 RepID=UPI0036B8EC52
MNGVAREVLRAPHPVLSKAAEVVDPTDPFVVSAAADLLTTLREIGKPSGLSAPQIGLGWRLIAVNAGLHPRSRSSAGALTLVNPRLAEASDWRAGREGCSSVPGLLGEVPRATKITVYGELPRTGESLTIEADAFEARCIQHQLDHLDGVLFLDRVSGARALHHRSHSCYA